MSLMQTTRASCVLNYNPGTFDNYLHHWVDATAGGRFVLEVSPAQQSKPKRLSVDINKFPVYKTMIFFGKTKDFLISGLDHLSCFWHNFLEFWILNALHCVLVWLYNYFDMSVTDESYVDETRVWRTKL